MLLSLQRPETRYTFSILIYIIYRVMYNHWEIEKKWQKYWEERSTFQVENDFSKPKYYVLDMFPYPSWAGLHVGHPEGFTANDIMARYKHAKGHNVLHPMGWDAFGLPAENYAIKTGTHPRKTTDENITTFKRQLKSLGFSYDWNREVDTTDPKYFQWTQWIFLKLFEEGLAYEQDLPINYCPSCKTGLANEEVLWDFSCERCWEQVEKKKILQWVLAITKYAERLLKDVDDLDWPEGIKDMQRNWIGKSTGCDVAWEIEWYSEVLHTYTTTVDTIYGTTFAVISPEYDNVLSLVSDDHKKSVEAYIDNSRKKSDLERTELNKDKTGIFTWTYLINPLSWGRVPLYVADYVLMSYGTWVVMGVPAHDKRDLDFAHKYDIEIIQVIQNEQGESFVYDDVDKYKVKWEIIDSWEFSGFGIQEWRKKITEELEKRKQWKSKVNYKLRDWLFSRQRYWGEPIPLIHLETKDVDNLPISPSDNAWVKDWNILMIGAKEFSKIYDGIYTKIVCDYNLPLELPAVEAYEPAGDGNSPLVNVPDFVSVQLAENLSWKRETNTMPQWGGSCWYYLRFMDPDNSEELVDPEVEKYWGQVDSYVGGAEHAVLHLLYARFWHKFLYDIWVVSHDEPFYRLRNQGLILWMSYKNSKWKLVADDCVEERDGVYFEIESGDVLEKVPAKMSKSLKNVINPDDIVREYGADTLRMYEMYMADFKDAAPWDTRSIVGSRRFLDKVYALIVEGKEKFASSDEEAMKALHKTIKKVSEDIENYKFNTAIAQLMICLNTWEPRDEALRQEWRTTFIQLLHPFAPHMAEECWEKINTPLISFVERGWERVSKIYLATGNAGKLERAQRIFKNIDADVVLETYPGIKEIEETGTTPMECALQKIEAYKDDTRDVPVMATDSAVYFENQDFDPTHVRRAAIAKAWKQESEMTAEEVAEAMVQFYQDAANAAGGSFDFYYIDAWVVLYPNGEIRSYEYKRPYEMTNTRSTEKYITFPMCNLYKSKITNTRPEDTSEEEYFREFEWQTRAMKNLFWYTQSIFETSWPEYDPELVKDNEVIIWVQVLWKLRWEIQIAIDESKDSVLEKAKSLEVVQKWTEGKEIVKEIYVPGKIVNIVVK